MELDTIRKEKQELEWKITALLNDFQRKTGLYIDDVDLGLINVTDSSMLIEEKLIHVKLDIRL